MAETEYEWTGGSEGVGLPYPTGESPPDGASQIKKLAEETADDLDDKASSQELTNGLAGKQDAGSYVDLSTEQAVGGTKSFASISGVSALSGVRWTGANNFNTGLPSWGTATTTYPIGPRNADNLIGVVTRAVRGYPTADTADLDVTTASITDYELPEIRNRNGRLCVALNAEGIVDTHELPDDPAFEREYDPAQLLGILVLKVQQLEAELEALRSEDA